MKAIPLLFVALFGFALSARADDARFAKANEEFVAGNYKSAISDYENEVAAHRWSANLFYNLGDAYFRDGDFGRAILNYERALQLEPRHPEAAANLQIARDQTRGLELAPTTIEKYFGRVSTSVITLAAAALFWSAIILLVWGGRGKALGTAILCMLASAGCAWLTWTLENGMRGHGAVVVGETQARVATADTARSMLVLRPGSEVVLLQQRGDWNYAVLPNDQRGWIPAKAAEPVRL